jgi:hypothetical protein
MIIHTAKYPSLCSYDYFGSNEIGDHLAMHVL